MSDYERIKTALASLEPREANVSEIPHYRKVQDGTARLLELNNGSGFPYFYVQFYFDESGALLGHGVWE